MNTKAFASLLTLMIAIVVIILALALSPVMKEFVDGARNETNSDILGINESGSLSHSNPQGLNCYETNKSGLSGNLSDFDKAACVSVDLYTPVFLGILLAIAGGIIVSRVVFS